jgi:hypothetical protein
LYNTIACRIELVSDDMEELKMRERQRTLRVQAQICKGRGKDKKIDPLDL